MTVTLNTALLQDVTPGTDDYGIARLHMQMLFAGDVLTELLPKLTLGYLQNEIDTPMISVEQFAILTRDMMARESFEDAKLWEQVWENIMEDFLVNFFNHNPNTAFEVIDDIGYIFLNPEFVEEAMNQAGV